ncbi:MAG: 50S ribosomal protein L31e [Nitrososphaerota archaeon]
MSQEQVERVYTINLGKVLLSPNNQRAKRAINMIKEFAARHMKSENIKIEEDVSHLVWARGIRHPPRKIRVKLTKDDGGNVLISKYQEEETKTKKEAIVEEKPKPKKSEEAVEEKTTETKEEKVETKPKKPKADVKPEKPKTESKQEAKPAKPKKEEKPEKKAEEKSKAKSDKKIQKK